MGTKDWPLWHSTIDYFQFWFCTVISHKMIGLHDDVIKWNHFPCYWPFVRGIHWSPVNSPQKGQWCGALMFSLICVSTNNWVNNQEAGDLRRYHGHYDIIVMGSGLMDDFTALTREGFQRSTWNLVGWWTVPWRKLMYKMAMLGEFLHIPQNLEIFNDRLGPGLRDNVAIVTL